MQKYLRLLSYQDAITVIKFVNENNKEDYAHITSGGVSLFVSPSRWDAVEAFIKKVSPRYELTRNHPSVVEKEIVANLKKHEKATSINEIISRLSKIQVELINLDLKPNDYNSISESIGDAKECLANLKL